MKRTSMWTALPGGERCYVGIDEEELRRGLYLYLCNRSHDLSQLCTGYDLMTASASSQGLLRRSGITPRHSK